MPNELRNFLTHSYDELEEMNLKAKEQRKARVAPHKIQEERIKYLTDERRIKAVTWKAGCTCWTTTRNF